MRMFKGISQGETDNGISFAMRELNEKEMSWVSGGEAGCGPGACGDSGVGAGGGELATVTVSTTADSPSPGGQGQAAAEIMVQQMEMAFTGEAAALLMFFGFIAQAAAAHNVQTAPLGNPMGDPSPGGP